MQTASIIYCTGIVFVEDLGRSSVGRHASKNACCHMCAARGDRTAVYNSQTGRSVLTSNSSQQKRTAHAAVSEKSPRKKYDSKRGKNIFCSTSYVADTRGAAVRHSPAGCTRPPPKPQQPPLQSPLPRTAHEAYTTGRSTQGVSGRCAVSSRGSSRRSLKPRSIAHSASRAAPTHRPATSFLLHNYPPIRWHVRPDGSTHFYIAAITATAKRKRRYSINSLLASVFTQGFLA